MLYWMIWRRLYPPFHWQYPLFQLPRKRRTKRLSIHREGSRRTCQTTREHRTDLYSSQTTHRPLHFHTTYPRNNNPHQEPKRDQDEHTDSLQWRMKETRQLKLDNFLLEVEMYQMMNNRVYDTDWKKIIFTLSFMKNGVAEMWKQSWWKQHTAENATFGTWEEFKDTLKKSFTPADKEGNAITKMQTASWQERPPMNSLKNSRTGNSRVE